MTDQADNGGPRVVARPSLQTGPSRRQLLQRAGALSISTVLLGGLLDAYGIRARAQTTDAGSGGGFDPKKYAGTQINILMTGDENDHRALGDLLPELEEETGITVEVTSPALAPLIEKTLQNLKAEQSSFELINYLGFLTTQQVGGGYYEKLNSYIENPE